MGNARGWRARTLVVAMAMIGVRCTGGAEVDDDPGANVILITLDGVRAQEMFGMPDAAREGGDALPAFPRLRAALAEGGVIYGDPTRFDEMTTSNRIQRSLPGYLAIFAGYEQPCYDNDCPRIGVETVLEYVQRVRGYRRGEVAVFASSRMIGRAVESVADTLAIDVGVHGDTGADCVLEGSTRRDRCTWALAMRYLDERRPRLLYVSLVDSDLVAHRRDYREYLAALRRYDGWLDELARHLRDDLGDAGARTTIIVTTDHGRGNGDHWDDHLVTLPGSEQVFLAAFGPQVHHGRLAETRRHAHADLRPTIEVLFGLAPSTCRRCGEPLAEVVGDVPATRAPVAVTPTGGMR